MLFFSIGVLLTNAYRVYLRVNEDEGITTKSNGLLSHYEFRKAIALYWINDKEALNIYKSCAVTILLLLLDLALPRFNHQHHFLVCRLVMITLLLHLLDPREHQPWMTLHYMKTAS